MRMPTFYQFGDEHSLVFVDALDNKFFFYGKKLIAFKQDNEETMLLKNYSNDEMLEKALKLISERVADKDRLSTNDFERKILILFGQVYLETKTIH